MLARDETQSCAPERNARLRSALDRVCRSARFVHELPGPEYLARHQLDQATALVAGEIAGEAVDGDVDGRGLRVRLSPERFGDGGQVARAEQHDVRCVLECDAVGGRIRTYVRTAAAADQLLVPPPTGGTTTPSHQCATARPNSIAW